jgi:hypothetical protein
MNTQSIFEFKWLSPLGISVILFLLYGAMHVVVGILVPFFVRPDRLTTNTLLTSERADTALLGASPEALIAQDRPLGMLRHLMNLWIAGLMLGLGSLQLVIAWFGLRAGQGWALWSLTAADLSMVPFWWLILARYGQAGAVPGPGELPPMVTYLVLIPIAALLGWVGLR